MTRVPGALTSDGFDDEWCEGVDVQVQQRPVADHPAEVIPGLGDVPACVESKGTVAESAGS